MANLVTERVLSVHHWNDTLFSFRTTRDRGLRFENGQFVMIGVEVDGRPITRAYSIASPNYEEHLEFFSIKVLGGKLTSRLQHLREGDPIVVSKKPTGTLVLHDLKPGKHLYLLATGTGLAPFLRECRGQPGGAGQAFAAAGQAPILGKVAVAIGRQSARPKRSKQKARPKRAARLAELTVRAATVWLQPSREHADKAPIELRVVHAREDDPPLEREAVQWSVVVAHHAAGGQRFSSTLRDEHHMVFALPATVT